MYKTLYTREYQQMLALLRVKRTDAQVSQVELARRLAWTQADVSKLKRGAIFGANSLRYLSTFLFALCAKELHLRQKQPA